MDLAGHSAIVTGGGSGMGAATAKHLAKQGVKVALFDINLDGAQKTASNINGIAIECDVSNEESSISAINQANEAHGASRILVNCAGIAPASLLVGKEGPHDLNLFSKVININLIGSFNMMRLVANHMTELEPINETGERGIIINTASVAAYEGQIGQAAYSASKGGIVGMTLPIARELARFGIRVNTIAPGLMETPMLTGFSQEVQDSLIATTVFPKRLGKPEEFADLAVHICENTLINGETIRLDGAIRLAPR